MLKQSQIKTCDRGCGLTIFWAGKDHDKKGSTGWLELPQLLDAAGEVKIQKIETRGPFEILINSVYYTRVNFVEHTYPRCDRLKRELLTKVDPQRDGEQSTLF